MSLNFRNRLLLTIGISCVVCTTAAIFVSTQRIEANGQNALVDKSRAVLSRLEVGAGYVAEMQTLDTVVAETVKKYPDGRLPAEQKLKVLKSVPIFAAFKIGERGAEQENYQFRVASDEPRNKENLASPEERVIIDKFRSDPTLKEWVETSADGKYMKVTRPVKINESQGCLTCHGNPSKSPWGNGKDILGYDMENMKDGQLRGTFTIVSSLEPVKASTRAATTNILFWGGVFTVLALFLGFVIVRGPVSILAAISARLGLSADELASASNQISAASQAISAGSTQAASSLEETVASVEELTSMVKLNADNAGQAANLSQEGTREAEGGEHEMQKLIASMTEISQSSKKIEEIINVIDDIAFQTNLLALNAAVEAARAGEQGKGFAVVAEAVRSLAQRSAGAAKDISVLIKDSVGKIEAGARTADASASALKRIVVSVKKVSGLNGEIASASQEQANGIAQISKAMTELDGSTQQNASASEEASASASRMEEQAAELRDLVRQLLQVIEGSSTAGQRSPGGPQGPSESVENAGPAPRQLHAVPTERSQPARKAG
jgi:methyl-accepting chemotaxis protein